MRLKLTEEFKAKIVGLISDDRTAAAIKHDGGISVKIDAIKVTMDKRGLLVSLSCMGNDIFYMRTEIDLRDGETLSIVGLDTRVDLSID